MNHEHERSLKGKNKILRLLQGEVDHYQEKVDELQPQADHYKGLVGEVREEFYDWKERKDELAKSKRLNEICHKKNDKSSETFVNKMFDDDIEVDSDSDGLIEDDLKPKNGTPRQKLKKGTAASKSRIGAKPKIVVTTPRDNAWVNGSGASSGSRSGSGGNEKSRGDSQVNESPSVTHKSEKAIAEQERAFTAGWKKKSARPKSSAERRTQSRV